ncbi:MAG: hypothetical protein ACPG8O_04120, partial [Alcanivorax nanhaiticus]
MTVQTFTPGQITIHLTEAANKQALREIARAHAAPAGLLMVQSSAHQLGAIGAHVELKACLVLHPLLLGFRNSFRHGQKPTFPPHSAVGSPIAGRHHGH